MQISARVEKGMGFRVQVRFLYPEGGFQKATLVVVVVVVVVDVVVVISSLRVQKSPRLS